MLNAYFKNTCTLAVENTLKTALIYKYVIQLTQFHTFFSIA